MKNLKLYSILILLSSLLLSVSCVNNDDKGSGGDGGGEGGEVPLTPENLEKGEWEIAYMTHRIKAIANGGPDVTFRMYSMDGFTKEFYDGSRYMERNTYGEETIYEGEYSLYPKQDSIILKYSFLDPDTELVKDSISRIQVFKLNEKMLVYHISFKKKAKDDAYFRQLVFYLRNKKNAPDEFLIPNDVLKNNEKQGRVDPKLLNGSWEIVNVQVQSKNANNTTWTVTDDDKAELEKEKANIGLIYSYNTEQQPYKFKETVSDGGEPKTGVFTITDDVMHYYRDTDVDGKTKKVMDSMAIDMADDGKSFKYIYNAYNLTATSFYVRRHIISFKKVQ
ncbi:hypothetical protein [Dysgonomonas massiliensis]|uniref:hypothetical protein n=1 Tax=Dysgonomonas massiliensis TaxID=2040292 RepID=UPI000C769E2E|nr:hypothetical protein [Dysgonomonas massiliensis]